MLLFGSVVPVLAHEPAADQAPELPIVEWRVSGETTATTRETAQPEAEAASSQTDAWQRKVANKAQIGLDNIATGWVELPKSVAHTYNETNFLFAITGGVIKGVVHAVARTGAGLWDLFTSPLPSEPIPNPYRVWDDWQRETRYGPVFAPKSAGRKVVIDFFSDGSSER